jgi:hypothetical protein
LPDFAPRPPPAAAANDNDDDGAGDDKPSCLPLVPIGQPPPRRHYNRAASATKAAHLHPSRKVAVARGPVRCRTQMAPVVGAGGCGGAIWQAARSTSASPRGSFRKDNAAPPAAPFRQRQTARVRLEWNRSRSERVSGSSDVVSQRPIQVLAGGAPSPLDQVAGGARAATTTTFEATETTTAANQLVAADKLIWRAHTHTNRGRPRPHSSAAGKLEHDDQSSVKSSSSPPRPPPLEILIRQRQQQ